MDLKRIKVIFLIVVVLVLSTPSFSQENDETINLRSFGLGLNVNQLRMSDVLSDILITPANKIFITVTPTNFLRFEPEFGFMYSKDKERDLEGKVFLAGIGAYGMYQKGKTNFFVGLKFEYSVISRQYIDFWLPYITTEEAKRLGFGPAIGAEYFFGESFSLGGQVSILYLTLKSEVRGFSYEDFDNYFFITETGVTLRFYF